MICAEDIERIKAGSFVRTVEHHRQLESTNDHALELAMREDLDMPLLVLADRQTAGRGRGDNHWWAASGALTFSLVISIEKYELIAVSNSQLSVTTALALYDALSDFVSPSDIRLKWPNDVYLGSRKVAGILLERSTACPDRLVVGVGINVNNALSEAPSDIRALATSLCDWRDTRCSLNDVLSAALKHIARRYQMMAACKLRLADEWQALCYMRTHRVSVTSGQGTVTGTCHGIDDQGALIIQNAEGVFPLLSGVVSRIERS